MLFIIYGLFLDAAKNKLNYFRGKDYLENICKDLKENIIELINYEKKKCYHLLMKKAYQIMSKKFVIYAKNNSILMIMVKSEIIVILLENIEELLTMFAI